LVRISDLHSEGRRFESYTAHQTLRSKVCPEEHSDEGQHRKMQDWVLYIIQCKDASLYTGITTDIDKRIKRHNEGRATKYTRIRKPVKLVYTELCDTECKARQREIEVKKFPRKKKFELINNQEGFDL
jgi:putative endonuclease